ncbi:uncharacterized protein HMPREF1541_10434 [Cyphellophora europaea CBS 101466]|uniref:Uncharacterized protein n=1 Tax=Cyphellophora europaea (strain CBS 101466) TaxID=1220924 RepID=W2SA22_CYPE1|nr:uncharacterized protein HMPREF1541_10434 [Cyphellophora europaea CBS 101466]ETN44764.1 hypothetical protein HMPREF1541_10434 [Cyphellophora europaea CBS 101466]
MGESIFRGTTRTVPVPHCTLAWFGFSVPEPSFLDCLVGFGPFSRRHVSADASPAAPRVYRTTRLISRQAVLCMDRGALRSIQKLGEVSNRAHVRHRHWYCRSRAIPKVVNRELPGIRGRPDTDCRSLGGQ